MLQMGLDKNQCKFPVESLIEKSKSFQKLLPHKGWRDLNIHLKYQYTYYLRLSGDTLQLVTGRRGRVMCYTLQPNLRGTLGSCWRLKIIQGFFFFFFSMPNWLLKFETHETTNDGIWSQKKQNAGGTQPIGQNPLWTWRNNQHFKACWCKVSIQNGDPNPFTSTDAAQPTEFPQMFAFGQVLNLPLITLLLFYIYPKSILFIKVCWTNII